VAPLNVPKEEKGIFDDDSELEEMSPTKSKKGSPERRKVGFNSPE